MQIHAPAKLNLCLYLGARREDGLHELCSLFEPLALADLITLPTLTHQRWVKSEGVDHDEVVCPGVEGENLARERLPPCASAAGSSPPLRVEIEKRIPVAAGLGGGSADAAAVLRLAAGEVADLEQIAAALGADVPSQLTPALALVRGAGERIERLPEPKPHAVVLLPGGGGLSTAEVFAEADRLGLGRADRGAGASWPSACARRPAPAPRRSPTRSCSSTTSSRRRARCGPRSAPRSMPCAMPARHRRCSPAPVRLPSGSSTTLAAAHERRRTRSIATTRSSARPGSPREAAGRGEAATANAC